MLEHTMHLLKSFGSTPGRALMSRGSMWVGPSGKRCPPDTRLRATPIMQLRVAVSWWGSVKVSRAGYVLWQRQRTISPLCSCFWKCGPISYLKQKTSHSATNSKEAELGLKMYRWDKTHFSNTGGMTNSGLIRARFCRAWAASRLPVLLNMASSTGCIMLSTKSVMSSSVSLWLSGIGVSHVGFL